MPWRTPGGASPTAAPTSPAAPTTPAGPPPPRTLPAADGYLDHAGGPCLGGIGLVALLGEPAAWVLAGGSATAFLTTADALTRVVVLIRALHVGAVVVALVAMYRPAANAYFRT